MSKSNSSSSSKIIDLENRQRLSKPDMNRVVSVGTYGIDENGEVVYDILKRRGQTENGSGFVISYTEQMTDFIVKTRVSSVVRVFVYLAHNQQYANSGQFGYRCSRKHLEDVLQLDRKSVYSSLKFLEEQFLVLETRINGQSEFMVNPKYVTIGKSRREREVEWSRRWAEHWKKTKSS